MWTLILLGLLMHDIDKSYSFTIPNFSTKEYCLSAGNEFVRGSTNRRFSATSKRSNEKISIEQSIYWHYECIEVK